ncbi:MAG: AAA family ATPase [Olsenella sp.]|jgi:DNA helicase-2/ATP-dependent DNA helicase PcrA|nr:AAA family ATPase [Olsenella sp.]MCI1288710.1 AAA family ATPase [Olsenella sp.]
MDDKTFAEEQEHLDAIYAELERVRDILTEELEVKHKEAAKDLKDLSEEVRIDFGGADETMETLAAIETLNSVIDTYNQQHDFEVEKLGRCMMLLRQPYFAKVRLQMRPGRPARDVYIGSAGMTDRNRMPLVVDWRNPVAETYYNQQMGPTSYKVDGRVRTVNLELRRQFDITRNHLNAYFDTTVAIEDSLLLNALKRHHTEKLQAITATIQREQNQVVRHDDVPVLLVDGIAGSGKTSVLLQRIAFLFYRERSTLSPDQVFLFTPNNVFEKYIDTVLPTLGESNPQTFTWRDFLASLGLADRATGAEDSPESLERLEAAVEHATLEEADLRDIRQDDVVLLKASSVRGAVQKFERFGLGPRMIALVKDELHDRLDRRIASLAHDEDVQEAMLGMDVDEQIEAFGEVISPANDDETYAYAKKLLAKRYAPAHDQIESLAWLRLDRIGCRLLGKTNVSAAEWMFLRLLITGHGADDARYVMIDEVQDYTPTQLIVLARYFGRAHFLLLGDRNQAIHEGTATFEQIRDIFTRTHGSVEECRLLTSYRSSPEITHLFAGLMDADERVQLSSVQREGVPPRFHEVADGQANAEAYLQTLCQVVEDASRGEGLTAIVAADRRRVSWLSKQLAQRLTLPSDADADDAGEKDADAPAEARPLVKTLKGDEPLPARGVVLMDLALAKGLEFDHVIVPDAQADVYPDTPLARRRLYTAISRAMHEVDLVSQGRISPLLADAMAEAAGGEA